MPTKTNKSQKNEPSFPELIGRIRRSAKDAHYAINWVKHCGSDALLAQLTGQFVPSHYSKFFTGDDPFPSKYSDIHSHQPRLSCSKDWRIELRWNLAVLRKFTPQLKTYVQLRSQFGNHFLLGDYDGAERTLDLIEAQISTSLWSLDKRFLLLQYKSGFGANKGFLANLHATCNNPAVNLLGMFFSIRAEHAVDYLSYEALLTNKLLEISSQSPKEVAAYFESLLAVPCTLNLDYASYILFRCNDASIIDRLNGVVRFTRSKLASEETQISDLAPFALGLTKLAQATGEPSLLAATQVLSDRKAALVLPDDYKIFLSALDAYTEGRYEDCIPPVRCFLKQHPSSLVPYVICAKASAHLNVNPESLGEPLSMATRILQLLTAIMNGKADLSDSVRLLKLAVDLGENHLAFSLYNLAFELNGTPHDSYSTALAELSSKFPDLTVDSSIGNSSRLSQMLESFPSSSTLKFLDCQARHALVDEGKTLKISEDRLRFYSALELLASTNDEEGLKTIEAIYLEARSTTKATFAQLRQVTVVLFQHYLMTGKLLNACTLTIDSYHRSIMLASCLDRDALLKALLRNPLEGGSGNIYLPAIAFLAPHEDFALYKSLDRFLRSHSCTRMTHILDLSPHFSSDVFALVIGEAMTEDVMSLGWRYAENFSDVELQRIELCAYLVRTKHSKASQYAEEAKAITKRRSVRDALKHVSASKMRLDIPRIKKLYRERVESIFERRRTFLQAEEAGKLEQIDVETLVRLTLVADTPSLGDAELRPSLTAELSQESEVLLDRLLVECYTLYLWVADCGLNFLLSADVRHGFLKNHLRKPFQTQNVISSKAADGSYQTNEFRVNQLKDNLSDHNFNELEAEFRVFSGKIDDLILHLNTAVVQINISPAQRARLETLGIGDRLRGSDSGYLDYESFFADMVSRKADLDKSATIDDFTEICFGEMQRLTEVNFAKIRNHFILSVPQSIRSICEGFADSIRQLVEIPYLKTSMLKDLNDARDDAVSEANEIAGWFEAIDEGLPGDIELAEMADVVATLLRSCHPSTLGAFEVVCDVERSGFLIKGAAFSAVFDVLYILLQNVAEHSGLHADEVKCLIHISECGDSAAVEVSNNVCDSYSAKHHMALANNLLDSTQPPAPEGEGKTGLRKINKILQNVIGETSAEISVRAEGRRVIVRLVLPTCCVQK